MLIFQKTLCIIKSGEKHEPDYQHNATRKVLRFDTPNEAWLDFVSENRSGNYNGQDYALIYGPVANDDVYTTFMLYSAGVLTKEQTLEALKYQTGILPDCLPSPPT